MSDFWTRQDAQHKGKQPVKREDPDEGHICAHCGEGKLVYSCENCGEADAKISMGEYCSSCLGEYLNLVCSSCGREPRRAG